MFKRLKVKYLNTNLKRKIIILIILFVTLLPTTLITILAYTYYKLGIESLFNEKISRSINETVVIAEKYLKEHKDNIKADIWSIAKGIDLNYYNLIDKPDLFVTYLDKQVEFRNLAEIVIFQNNNILAKNTFSFAFTFEKISEADLQKADTGEIVIIDKSGSDKVQAIVKLNNFIQTYMLIGKHVDQSILNYLENSQGSASQYQNLISDLKLTEIKLELSFIIAFLVLCICAILLGTKLASIITNPLKNLVDATEKLKEGDFSITLEEKPGRDETSILTRAFNRMTETLAFQRNQLIKANNLIDERRRFIEKVLSEITAGVIALNFKKEVTLINYSAMEHLKLKKEIKKIDKIFPEINKLLNKAALNAKEVVTENINIIRNTANMQLLVRIGCLSDDKGIIKSFIITFDDITQLVYAQRNAAWADVARRIAHEVKNPLTPINLSAERLKTKFLKQIKTDKITYEKYIDTIIRHVTDIGSIVDDFVQFARIPAPKFKKVDLIKILQDLIFSQSNTYKKISYEFLSDIEKCMVICDELQITQALINILKNAAEAIEIRSQQKSQNFLGKILIKFSLEKEAIVEISDNGIGIKGAALSKIFEPYVTTKPQGTGIGLAIVKKIIEDHNGVIQIKSASLKGTAISFTLPIAEKVR